MTTTDAFVNYYEILEVGEKATDEQIREAVKRQRRTWMKRQQAPSVEKQREAEDRVRQIDAAERTLLVPESRKAFDQRLASYVPPKAKVQDSDAGADWLRRAQEFLAMGDAQSAAYAAREATDKQASHHEAWATRGQADFLIGRDQDAIFEFNEAIRLSPNSDEYHFDLGSVYESKNKDKSALQCYERAAELAPTNPLYKVSISGIYLDNDMPEKALPLLEAVHQTHPNVEEFNFYLASALNECVLKSWTAVGKARVITKPEQIAPSRELLNRATQLKFEDQQLKVTLSSNLQLVERAAVKRFRMPGFTAAKKTTGVAAGGGLQGLGAGCAGAGCVIYLIFAAIVGVIGVAFHANPALGVLVVLIVAGGFYALAWRPGWKWNQIDARGVTVTSKKAVGQHAQGRN